MRRREFLKSGAASLLLAGLGPLLLGDRRAEAIEPVPSYDEFEVQLDSWFQLRGATDHQLQLVEVQDHPIEPSLDQFSLRFRGPANDPVAEGLYEVTSAQSAHTLFVQPSGSDADGENYLVHCSLIRPLAPSRSGVSCA